VKNKAYVGVGAFLVSFSIIILAFAIFPFIFPAYPTQLGGSQQTTSQQEISITTLEPVIDALAEKELVILPSYSIDAILPALPEELRLQNCDTLQIRQ
jgi:hypothetical protein